MAGSMDSALEMLAGYSPEFHRLSNHGPMAAEALLVMGRDNEVLTWVERYRRRLEPMPKRTAPIDLADWQRPLGDFARVADWRAFFDEEIESSSWQEVLAKWVPRLAPGLAAAGFHGLIRTGHAVRSLLDEETPLRRGEFAEGLALWAARFQSLPALPNKNARRNSPSEAIRAVPLLPDDRRVNGLISQELAALDGFTPFAAVIDLIEIADLAQTMSQITATMARAYLANAQRAGFTMLHAVTGPSALRHMVPLLDPKDAAAAVRYAWHAAAGTFSAVGRDVAVPFEDPRQDDEALIDCAVATRDEHAIKFTEACLRENALMPDAAFRAAAADLASRLRVAPND